MRETGATFVGSLGCKSSSCHGGAGPKRSQYITWSREDFHVKAYAVLINSRSSRIAETLGLAQAQASARCTGCHSPFQSVAPSRLAPTARPDEGVSCENCHGAAGPWLRGHTRTDWHYSTRISAGMRDLRNLYVRANSCVACHQNVDVDILNAGHPALTFELDSQMENEPKHWRDEGQWFGPRAWLTGQAVALREMSWQLAREPQPDEELIGRWNGVAWLLEKTTTAESTLPQIAGANTRDFATMQSQAEMLARSAANFGWNSVSIRNVLNTLSSAGPEFSDETVGKIGLASRARRLVLALDRLTMALNQAGPGVKTEPEMKLLFEDIHSAASFEPLRFASHLQSLHLALSK